jgi:hypothetical protein
MSGARTTLVVACLLAAGSAGYASVAESFAEGNKLYRAAAEAEGDTQRALYLRAAASYARATADGQNAYVLYNLGNAYYRAGRLGNAIAAYRRAEILMPRSGVIRRNLALAREGAPGGGTAPKPHPAAAAFFFWYYALSLSEVEALAAFSFIICMATLAGRLFAPERHRGRLKMAATAFGVVAAVFVLSSLVKLGSSELDGAVVVKEATVRSEPAGRAVELHVLREGSEVRSLGSSGAWTRIEWGASNRGWVESSSLDLLTHPPATSSTSG